MKKEKMVKRTHYFPIALLELLNDYSEKVGMSSSVIIRISVAKYLYDHPLPPFTTDKNFEVMK